MELRPVERTSASGAVFDQLFEELVAGRLAPGDALPAERSLTNTLQVNRQAVREALQRLAQAGLVDIHQGDSTRVRDYRTSGSLELLPHLLVSGDGSPDPAVARSIMEMRASVGPDVARLAAGRALPATIELVEEIVADMQSSSDDLERLATLDLSYWDTLVDAADNIAYRLAFNSLRQTYEPLAASLRTVLSEELGDVKGHAAISRAIAAGDEKSAQRAAARLLAKGTARVTELLRAIGSKEGA
jgi:DNA-binding FadR family transcriptional regulator